MRILMLLISALVLVGCSSTLATRGADTARPCDGRHGSLAVHVGQSARLVRVEGNGAGRYLTQSDSNGIAHFRFMAPDHYSIAVDVPPDPGTAYLEFPELRATSWLPGATQKAIDLRDSALVDQVQITIRVLSDQDDMPVAGAFVTGSANGDPGTAEASVSAVTNDSGIVRLSAGTEDRVTLRIQHPHFATVLRTIETQRESEIVVRIVESVVVDQSFEPLPTGTIAGVVVDSSGHPLSHATISILSSDSGWSSRVVADSGGQFDISQLPPAIYTLRVQFLGFRDARLVVGLDGARLAPLRGVIAESAVSLASHAYDRHGATARRR